ncbi:hypothetical protein DBR37_15525 [Herminiimonas sp. KBW02]|uniref:hypothetical protein n=1 Tax=Herminiimonas sp. KBW02 TaxID=2153363 RepID=UPI000F5983FC|nr:hypothetical protein [Herminiimonas sp. KBW02]RQO33591.1 hypothetical protein DBR37_15525 [Herminiimonas sp. KBW02]
MKFIPVFFAILCALTISASHAQALSFVEQDEGNDMLHGLKYVGIASANFVAAYNKEHGTSWRSLGPNSKLMLTRCLVPLKTRWSPPASRTATLPAPTDWRVKVSCDKTVSNTLKIQRWETLIPTTRRD